MWRYERCSFAYFLYIGAEDTSSFIIFKIENYVRSRRPRWNSHYNFTMLYHVKYINFVLADGCGHIFLKKIMRKRAILNKFDQISEIFQNVDVIVIFWNKIKVYYFVLYVHTFKIVYVFEFDRNNWKRLHWLTNFIARVIGHL